jgi:type II secretory pathway pseudopilin PulG
MFMLALLMIALAIAAPKVAKDIQRDRELETMHRGKQYARAVKLYYKKFGAYPANVDALVNTNQIRFLRKKYIDPTTGKDVWKPIALGQNKAPTAMGFFGVPLNGAGAGGGLCGNALPSSTPSGSSSSSSFGSSSGSSGSSFGSSSGSSGSSFGTTSPTAGCPSDTSGAGSATDPNAAANGATDPNAAGGNSGSQSTNDSSGTTPGSGTGSTSGIGQSGQTGQTFGGAGIMGFSPQSPKQSILVYKKKNHYNEWEFVYDPIADQMMMQGGNTGGLGGNPATGGPGGIGGGTGSGIGGSGIGGSSFGGSSGIGGSSGSPGGPGSGSTPPPQQ